MANSSATSFLLGAAISAALLGWIRSPEVVRADGPEDEVGSEFMMRTESSSSGTALLFVLNRNTKVLNVYEAEGGSRATRGLSFIASRKIERDVHVTGYNDRSEYTYQDLLKRYQLEEARLGAPSGESGDKR